VKKTQQKTDKTVSCFSSRQTQ